MTQPALDDLSRNAESLLRSIHVPDSHLCKWQEALSAARSFIGSAEDLQANIGEKLLGRHHVPANFLEVAAAVIYLERVVKSEDLKGYSLPDLRKAATNLIAMLDQESIKTALKPYDRECLRGDPEYVLESLASPMESVALPSIARGRVQEALKGKELSDADLEKTIMGFAASGATALAIEGIGRERQQRLLVRTLDLGISVSEWLRPIVTGLEITDVLVQRFPVLLFSMA